MIDDNSYKAIKRNSKLSHQILAQIKENLMNGTLQPGDKLPSTAELAAQMNVGLSSIREAIKMLEGLDIIVSRQGEGTFVNIDLREGAFNALSLQLMLMSHSVERLVEFRQMYETAYTMLAMSNATPEDIEELETIVKVQEKRATYVSSNAKDEFDFHSKVLQATHNPYVIRLGEAMLELFLSTIPKIGIIETPHTVAKDHRKILQYLRTKDINGLNNILHKSFEGWASRLLGNPYVEPNE